VTVLSLTLHQLERLGSVAARGPLAVVASGSMSRVYPGVHCPTDVLAGWGLGAARAILCWSAPAWTTRSRDDNAPRAP